MSMDIHIVVADTANAASVAAQRILSRRELHRRPQVATPSTIPRFFAHDKETHVWDLTTPSGRRKLHPEDEEIFETWLDYAETCGAMIHKEEE